MNRSKFIEELSEKTKYSIQDSEIICTIYEKHFIVGRKNKQKIIDDLVDELKISFEEADEIYNKSSEIIATAIKNKILHPFKDA